MVGKTHQMASIGRNVRLPHNRGLNTPLRLLRPTYSVSQYTLITLESIVGQKASLMPALGPALSLFGEREQMVGD
jgi:hypothetical protein